VRIGLSAGDVAFKEADCFGTPVIEVAPLCAAARGGQVLLTDIGRIFVRREAQLERLEQLWKGPRAGELRVVLLAGEPGVGKTRLAAELAGRVQEEGAIVVAGRCDEDLGVPYQPFVEGLRQFVDHTDLRERLGRYGAELSRLVPQLTDELADLPSALKSDPETERYRAWSTCWPTFAAKRAWTGCRWSDWTNSGSSPSCTRRPAIPSMTRTSSWPGPSTKRRGETRSSCARCSAISPRPGPSSAGGPVEHPPAAR
jgi:hypothetical protein